MMVVTVQFSERFETSAAAMAFAGEHLHEVGELHYVNIQRTWEEDHWMYQLEMKGTK